MAKINSMDLEHLKDNDVSKFLASWGKYDSTDLRERLGSCPRAVLLQFAEGLLVQVTGALQQLQQCFPEDEAEGFDPDMGEQLEAALQALQLAALLCTDTLHECHANPPQVLTEAATMLHDHALLELGDGRPDVTDAVVKLCCTWWQYEAENREYLVSQALPYLLMRAITTRKAGHVKACYNMRGALELLDFEDSSINDMKRMLLQAAISPAFVTRPEGRKFLSCLLTVHPSMVQEMTSVIRNQIPAGRRSVLDAYGEVILRGWRDAVGPCLAEIETNLIQNLMLAAIHGSGQGLVGNIRRVLSELHRSKRLGGAGSVDSMLVRLYEPILFRALAATNAGVRRNSLQLLLDAFPLLDPEASTEEQDELLVRQFQCLSDGLTDACPSVRVVAAQGICTVLNLYWEIIPSATTAGFVARLTGQLAFDAALPAVRVAVLEGLQLLVDNQHAQPVLSKALPQLAPLMWDSSTRVKEAMADLLLCISTSRGLHFWEVVPLEVLLEQLVGQSSGSAASGYFAQKLHQLLVPSYFPNPQEGAARIAALLKDNPAAGQSFCRMLVAPFIHYMDGGKGSHQVQVPLEDILQLASSLMKHLLNHPPVKDPSSPPRKQRSRRRTGAREAPAGADDDAPAAGARGSRGKRKKAPAPAAATGSSAAAAEGAGANSDAEQEIDVMVVGGQEESVESWQVLLAGLSQICSGIGMALQHELCEEADLQDMFTIASLQQLLTNCPNNASERYVWRIAEALPCLAAAKQLLLSRMDLLAAGELLPEGSDAVAAAAAAAGVVALNGASEAAAAAATAVDAAAVLACLAAGSTGPKVAAVLCTALGLDWPGSADHREPASCVSLKAAAAGSAAAAGGNSNSYDNICCNSCGLTEPEDTMLLCDGCDAAFHTTCLVPALESIPEDDWFCPTCSEQIRASALPRNTAVAYISLMLLSDSGRQLLTRHNMLQRALPVLEQNASNAAAEAVGDDAVGSGEVQDAALVVKALQLQILHARAVVHVLAQGAEEQPAALAQGVASILQQLASRCCMLQRIPAAAASEADRQLLSCIQQLSGLLKDLWSALKVLGRIGDRQVETSTAAAASSAADCGCSLLAGLATVSAQVREQDVAVKCALVTNTQLLSALLSSQSSPVVQQRMKAWLLLWLQLLTTSPLAAAGGALKAEFPALLAAVLGGSSTRSAPSQAAAVTVEEWLPLLAAAAAQVDELEEPEMAAQQQQQQQSDSEAEDAENCNPNANTSNAAAAEKQPKSKSKAAASCVGDGLSLPPVLQAFVTTVARQKQVQPSLAAKCLQLCASSGEQSNWDAVLGSLRLGRLLGCSTNSLSAEQQQTLRQIKAAALEDNGTAALLAAEAVDRLLPVA